MNGTPPRNFNCKDEELPVVAGFLALSLARDLNDFTTFSPVFDAVYLEAYKTKIETVQELVEPKTETIELKTLTERIYNRLDELINPINRIEAYLKLAKQSIPISAADFGLVQLRKSIRTRDVENVLKLLRTVDANITKYKSELQAKGLTENLAPQLAEAGQKLAADKNKKYELVSKRTALVQNNLGVLNELNDQVSEICNIGKVLYKPTDKAKLKDYTFAQLMKQVRRKDKPAEEKTPETQPTEPA